MLKAAAFIAALLIDTVQGAMAQSPQPAGTAPSAVESAPSEPDGRPATAARLLSAAMRPYPKAVRRILGRARKGCLAEGGESFSQRPGLVRIADLNGDGRHDYLINLRESRCAGRPGMFNGTGGWDLDILVGRPSGGPKLAFSGRVRDYEVSGARGAVRMTFHLHGSYCGLAGAEDCVRTRRITAGRFEFRDR